jgi:hypothetical protein
LISAELILAKVDERVAFYSAALRLARQPLGEGSPCCFETSGCMALEAKLGLWLSIDEKGARHEELTEEERKEIAAAFGDEHGTTKHSS